MSFFEEREEGHGGNCGGCGFGGGSGMLLLLLLCGCGGCGCGGHGHGKSNMGCIDVCELIFIIFLLGMCGNGCHKN